MKKYCIVEHTILKCTTVLAFKAHRIIATPHLTVSSAIKEVEAQRSMERRKRNKEQEWR